MAGPDGVYTNPRFLPPRRVDEICAALAAVRGELAAVQTAPGSALSVDETVRKAWDLELPEAVHDEIVARIQGVHGALEDFFSVRLEPCDAVAALRYPPGAFYRTHRDASSRPDPHGLHRRAVSLVLFLNTAAPRPGASFTGGTLRLHEMDDAEGAPHDVTPTAGTLVAFRSSVLHEVLPVEAGTRLSVVTWLRRSRPP